MKQILFSAPEGQKPVVSSGLPSPNKNLQSKSEHQPGRLCLNAVTSNMLPYCYPNYSHLLSDLQCSIFFGSSGI